MFVPPAGQKSQKVGGYDGRAMKVVITIGYGYGYIQFVMTLRIQSEVGGCPQVTVPRLSFQPQPERFAAPESQTLRLFWTLKREHRKND